MVMTRPRPANALDLADIMHEAARGQATHSHTGCTAIETVGVLFFSLHGGIHDAN
jgi:hypothetical protein